MDQRSKIGILGFGVEGRAMLDYLHKNGHKNLTICDQNVDLDIDPTQGVSVKLGPKYLENLERLDIVFRTPGIPFLEPQIQSAKAQGVEVSSMTKFFIEQCPCPIIGVTGTKGKGTTCSLIYEMLKKGGKNVYLGGNIGNPPVEFLDELKNDDVVVLELSSFQLQDLEKSPRYGVILNTTSDHLDYHVDRNEYMHAKENLLAHQHKDSLAVLNKDYEYCKFYEQLVRGELKWVSVKGGNIYCGDERIADVSEMKLVGSHNLENILPAVLIAYELGVKKSVIHEVIKTFKNLPYRLQEVRELGGVRYFNDSYSTTPETSMAAVDSFDEPTILIAGGYDKGLSYNEWAIKILTKPNLHTVILIGDTAQKMEDALVRAEDRLGEAEGSPTRILRRNNMEEAVVDAYADSEKGGVVVLSPAAASFDMYKNYKERGNDFMAQVRKLK